MQEKLCAGCDHFVQHYRKDGDRYGWLNCGHCTALLVKKRRPEDKPCPHFRPRPAEG